MRRFNLEEYLKDTSKEIITRDGRKARIICTDAKGDRPIIALVERFDGDAEDSYSYTKDGNFCVDREHIVDLFFATKKQEGYTCVYFSEGKHYLDEGIYPTKEDADKEGKKWNDYLTSIKIEWEEYDE